MKQTTRVLVPAAIALALATVAVAGEDKIEGEKWKANVTMKSSSFSMPARAMDICLPKANPDQAAMQQQGEKNCTVSNVQHNGNKTSADITCTGKHAAQTHWEVEKTSDTSMHGTMSMKSENTTMDMTYDYTKVGGACELPNLQAMQGQSGADKKAALKERLKGMLGGSGN